MSKQKKLVEQAKALTQHYIEQDVQNAQHKREVELKKYQQKKVKEIKKAKQCILSATARRECKVIVYSCSDLEVVVPDYSDWWEDDYSSQKKKEAMESVRISSLKGLAADVRDYLVGEGFHLVLRHAEREKRFNCRLYSWNEWNIVASW